MISVRATRPARRACRGARRAVAVLFGVALALLVMANHAAAAGCPPAKITPLNSDPDCKGYIPAPHGYPTQGGTCTVHPGVSVPRVVRLPGGAYLCAGGETAAPYSELHPHGRAIFRISGSLKDPGGINIVVSASTSNIPTGAELLPRLFADAYVYLPPNTVLLRLVDPTTLRFVVVPNGHIRQTSLYKIVRRGRPLLPSPALSPLPSILPATGGSPFGGLLELAAIVALAGLWLGGVPRFRRRGARGPRAPREWIGVILFAGGVLAIVATGAAFAYAQMRPAAAGFGTLADATSGPVPRAVQATGPPTRLVIPRLGIDTPVRSLGIVDGAWQVPAYAAGYLSGSAWPGSSSNDVITGHDDRDGAVFRHLGGLRNGDVVEVYVGARSYRYAVYALGTVPATRINLLYPTRGPVLTLITCAPYLIDTERLVARARLVTSG